MARPRLLCGAGGAGPHLNQLMSRLGPEAWSALRLALSRALSTDQKDMRLQRHLTPMAQAELMLPVAIGDFTDFYASVFNVTNACWAFRAGQPVIAELQIRSGCLSRACLIDLGEAAPR